jgi:hypothetical protein
MTLGGPKNLLGCPESHELHQPVAGLFGAVLEREIRKYELGPHRDWLGLPQHVPVRRQLPEVLREPLLELAVEAPGLGGWKDGIPGPQLEVSEPIVDETRRPEAEPLAPRQMRKLSSRVRQSALAICELPS